MNFGGITSGLSALYPGMLQGEASGLSNDINRQRLDDALRQVAALTARGNAFQSMFGGGPQGAMAMPPGQSSTDTGGSMPGSNPMAFMGQQGQPAARPMAPQGAPTAPFASGPAGPAGGMPQNLMGGPPAGPAGPMNNSPPSGPPQQQGNGFPNGFPIGSPGQLDWRPIVQHLVKANPNLRPEVLAMAVDQFAPLMNAQAQHEWKALSMQLRGEQLDQRERQFDARQAGMDRRLDTRMEDNSANRDTRRELQGGRLESAAADRDTRRELAGARDETQRYGIDTRAENARAGRDIQGQRLEEARTGREQRGAENERRDETQRYGVDTRAAVGRESIGARREIAANRPESATQIKERDKHAFYKQVDSTIQDALDTLERTYKGGLSAAGISGKAQRLGEIMTNMAGWSDATAANEFKQQINIIRTQLPRLLTDRSITSRDERARINEIVPGLEAGSTTPITVKDLQYLQKLLRQRLPAAFEAPRSKEGGVPAGGAALQPMTPQAIELRQKALDAGHSPADVERALRDRGFDPAR